MMFFSPATSGALTIIFIDKITSWGYSVNTIHGEMNMYQRIEAETVFKDETQVMVATEAAGEGINLQFCHLMIKATSLLWVTFMSLMG